MIFLLNPVTPTSFACIILILLVLLWITILVIHSMSLVVDKHTPYYEVYSRT